MANAGSCKIGLNPKPSVCIFSIFSKGFEVRTVNKIKPIAMNA